MSSISTSARICAALAFLGAAWSVANCSRSSLPYEEVLVVDDAGADGASCPASVCAAQHANCGTLDGPCGKELCGKCDAPLTCGGAGTPNQCGCVPKTCAEVGAACGEALDGCDAVLSCGTCPPGEICGGAGVPNQCGANPCTPKTCADLGVQCGKVSDGCSAVLDCGGCAAPDTCGGGGVANVCGCTHLGCVALGATCGPASDTCGGTLDCGGCALPDTCGGAGVPNQCGCVPTTCAAEGAQCGQILDRCGGTLDCGGDCSEHSHHDHVSVCVGVGPTVCSEEGEVCTPQTCDKLFAECGKVNDGCANVIDCGTCAAPLVCGGGGIPNHCGCTKKTCDALGAKCGQVPDGCMGTLDCGACPAGKTCDATSHTCVP